MLYSASRSLRMIPVALALIGAGFDRNSVLFVGWFGTSRAGLPGLRPSPLKTGTGADEAVAVIAVTVFLSVIAHGITAAPLGTRIRQGGRP